MNNNLTKEIEKIYDEAEHSPLGRDEYINTLLGCLLKENIELRKECCAMKDSPGMDFLASENKGFEESYQSATKQINSSREQYRSENQALKEETVRIYQQMMSLYRAVKAANCNLDAIEEKCEANVWFSRLKERTY